MRTTIFRRANRLPFFAYALLCGLAQPQGAKADYIVSVDTSSLNGTQGFIDIEFNPGLFSLAATATVTNFSTDATILSSVNSTPAGTDGDVPSGTLPNTLIINNTDVLNDVYQPVTFGTFISFDVAFSGSLANGGTFGLTLYDSTFIPLLVNPSDPNNPNGTVGTIDLNPDGSTTAQSFPDSNGNTHTTFQPFTSSTPEPSSWLMLTLGAFGIWAIRKHRDQ